MFPNNFPKDGDKAQTIDYITKGLLTLGDYAKDKNVTVLLETHGDVVRIDDIVTIAKAAEHPNVALVWDPANMWTITKEPPAQAYAALKKYIRHVHVKDATLDGSNVHYTMLGQGNVPIFEAIDALARNGYKGYYSFEWEKLWHPEIADPELALADYPKAMKNYFKHV